MTDIEREQLHRKFDAEIANLLAETAKLNAEAAKFRIEGQWYFAVVVSGLTLAAVAVAKLFV